MPLQHCHSHACVRCRHCCCRAAGAAALVLVHVISCHTPAPPADPPPSSRIVSCHVTSSVCCLSPGCLQTCTCSPCTTGTASLAPSARALCETGCAPAPAAHARQLAVCSPAVPTRHLHRSLLPSTSAWHRQLGWVNLVCCRSCSRGAPSGQAPFLAPGRLHPDPPTQSTPPFSQLAANVTSQHEFPAAPAVALSSALILANAQLHDSPIDDCLSGTTACCALLAGRTLHVANVGDSRAVLAEGPPGGPLLARDLSKDQTPFRCVRAAAPRAIPRAVPRAGGSSTQRQRRALLAAATCSATGGACSPTLMPGPRLCYRDETSPPAPHPLLPSAGRTSACACCRRARA